LLNEARRRFPSETVNIRNARTGRHNPTNPRSEEYQDRVQYSDGTSGFVTRTRTVWNCFPVYFADVITTQPMPQQVLHRLDISVPGVSRQDIYRRAHNWLTDNMNIRIAEASMDLGRIRSSHTFRVTTDHTYTLIADFTIDVHDSRAEIIFSNTRLQTARPHTNHDIFLQSIADRAQAALIDFSNTLRAHIITR
jgi:hypothetical protein